MELLFLKKKVNGFVKKRGNNMGQKISSLYLKKSFNYIEFSQYYLTKNGSSLILKDYILRTLFKTYLKQQKIFLNNFIILQSDQKVQLIFNILTKRNFVISKFLQKTGNSKFESKFRNLRRKKKRKKSRVHLRRFLHSLTRTFLYFKLKSTFTNNKDLQQLNKIQFFQKYNVNKLKSVVKSFWLLNNTKNRLFLKNQQQITSFLHQTKNVKYYKGLCSNNLLKIKKKHYPLNGLIKKKIKILMLKRFLNYKKKYIKNFFLYSQYLIFLSKLTCIRFCHLSRKLIFKVLCSTYRLSFNFFNAVPLLFKLTKSFQKFFLGKATKKRFFKKFLLFTHPILQFSRTVKLKKLIKKTRIRRLKIRKILKLQKRRIRRLITITSRLTKIRLQNQKKFINYFLKKKIINFLQFIKIKYKKSISSLISFSFFKKFSFFYFHLIYKFLILKKFNLNYFIKHKFIQFLLRSKIQIKYLRLKFKFLLNIGRLIFFFFRSIKGFRRLNYTRYLHRKNRKNTLKEFAHRFMYLHGQKSGQLKITEYTAFLRQRARVLNRKLKQRKLHVKNKSIYFVNQLTFSWLKKFYYFISLKERINKIQDSSFQLLIQSFFTVKFLYQLQKNTLIRRFSFKHQFKYIKNIYENSKGKRRGWNFRKRLVFRGFTRQRKKLRRLKSKSRLIILRNVLRFKGKQFFSHFISSFLLLYNINLINTRHLFFGLHQRKSFRRYLKVYPKKFLYRILRLLKIYTFSSLFNFSKRQKKNNRFFFYNRTLYNIKNQINISSLVKRKTLNNYYLYHQLFSISLFKITDISFSSLRKKKLNFFIFSSLNVIKNPIQYNNFKFFYFRYLFFQYKNFIYRKNYFLNKVLKKIYPLFLKNYIKNFNNVSLKLTKNCLQSSLKKKIFNNFKKLNIIFISTKLFFLKRNLKKLFFFFRRFRFLNTQFKWTYLIQKFFLTKFHLAFFLLKQNKKKNQLQIKKNFKFFFRFLNYKRINLIPIFKNSNQIKQKIKFSFFVFRFFRFLMRPMFRKFKGFLRYSFKYRTKIRKNFFWWIRGNRNKKRRSFYRIKIISFFKHFYRFLITEKYRLKYAPIRKSRAKYLKMRRAQALWIFNKFQKKYTPMLRRKLVNVNWCKFRSRNLIIYLRSCSFQRFVINYLFYITKKRKKYIKTILKKKRNIILKKLKNILIRYFLLILKKKKIQLFFFPISPKINFFKIKLLRQIKRHKKSKWIYTSDRLSFFQQRLTNKINLQVFKNTKKNKYFKEPSKTSLMIFLQYLNNIHVRHLLKTKSIAFTKDKFSAPVLQKLSSVLKKMLGFANIQLKIAHKVATLFRLFKTKKLFKYKVLTKAFLSTDNKLIFAGRQNPILKFDLFTFNYFYKACYRSMIKQQFYTRKFFLSSHLLIIIINCLFKRTSTMFFLLYFSLLLRKLRKHLPLLYYMDRVFKFFFNPMREIFFPVKGIRLILRGRVNGTPRKKNRIHSYGSLKMQTLQFNCDFNQMLAFTKRYGTIGLRMWRFF